MRKIVILALLGTLLTGCATVQAQQPQERKPALANMIIDESNWQETIKILELKLIKGTTYDTIYLRAQNIGDRTLRFLFIDVYLLDKDGKPIKSETVMGEEYVKPNFIKEGTNLIVNRLPEWSGQIAIGKVYGIYDK